MPSTPQPPRPARAAPGTEEAGGGPGHDLPEPKHPERDRPEQEHPEGGIPAQGPSAPPYVAPDRLTTENDD